MSDTEILMRIAEDIGSLKSSVRSIHHRIEEIKSLDAKVSEDHEVRLASLENTRTRYEGVRGVVAGGIALLVSGLTAYFTGE